MPGLLINGVLVPVPGVEVLSPGQHPWVRLDSRDFRPRTRRVGQITIHTTKGVWPQPIIPGAGPGGKDKSTADYWSIGGGKNESGGAPLVVDDDGSIACLCDLALYEVYHATKCNPYSVGIEMFQRADGGIHEATLTSTVKLVLVLCEAFGIPLQVDSRPYANNKIIERLRFGGPDVVGVFGHRQNAWMFPEWLTPAKRAVYPNGYADRGRGDPGDEIFVRLRKAGAMSLDIDAGEELVYWKAVQKALNDKHGEKLSVDGVCGPGTVRVLRKLGMWNGGVFLEKPIA